jgi:hypothetical protein
MQEVTEGKRPLPISDAERHHYVAQFQLTKFKGKGRLYQLDKEDGSCEPVTPKKAAWSSNLYTVESTTGEHDGIVEGFFSVAERIEPPDQEVLTLSLNMLAESSQLINALPWTLLQAAEGAFICSDRPLTMHDPTPRYKWSAPAWLSSLMVEATMPLGRGSCLRIGPSQHERIAVRSTTKQVDRINRRTYGYATRFVYGPTAESLEDLHALAHREPDAIPKPIKKQMVMFEDPETADPRIADENAARGWDRYVEDPSGSGRMLSYEVLDSEEAARRSVAPRHDATLTGIKVGDRTHGRGRRRPNGKRPRR